MPLSCQRMLGGTHGAVDKAAASLTYGTVRREIWERRVSFVHSADLTAAMGVYDYGAAGGGTGNNSFMSSSRPLQRICSLLFHSEGLRRWWSSYPPPFLQKYIRVNQQLLI